ncbi:MAG: 30S ribosomal protein S16 [Parcubacteria group bacterium]|jgi:small subunit ribosomal protein S16
MLTIRFARTGKRNRAQFQIVLQEQAIAPGGRHVEVLGSYDPHSKKTVLKEEKIKYWLGQGAQPSDSAFNLLLAKGLVTGEKRKVKMPAKKVAEAPAEAVVPVEAKTEEASAVEAVEVSKEEVNPPAGGEEVAPVEEPKAE